MSIKVLQVNKLYYPITGGVERIVRQLAEGLKDQVDMKVLVCQSKGKSTVEPFHGVEIHRASSFGIAFSMPISLQFFRWFQKLRTDRDILHIHTPFPLADVALWLYGFSGKVVIWWHSDIVKQKRLLAFYRPFMLKLLKRADVIIVATQGHIEGSDYLPAFKEKCIVIPFGVEPELIQIAQTVETTRQRHGQPIGFLSVGRLIYYKGYDILIRAFARIPDAALTIIGEGPLEENLKRLAQDLGVQDRIVFRSHVSEQGLAQAFADCDIFVLSSVAKSEAFGLVQIEAMAYGKPVINTKLPSGVPYVSLDGITGLTVAPGDVDALSHAMEVLAKDRILREKYGKNAKERVAKDFTMERMLQQTLAVYQNLFKS